ncbi:DUF4158 domain-containing protein [Nonomuraea polychroma]|uniref:DUF4158 domain-containing protein n=1 Tax=Nonomuraea polychroma TaxID=46176 RepID=UPI003D8D0914
MSDGQLRAYTAFAELPSLSDLEKFFFLDAFDRDVIAKSRQDSHRLGVAVQIGTVRYKGLFLEDPLAVPWPVVDYLAEQLEIVDPSQVKRYGERPKTAYEHAWMIRDAYGYHDFDDRESWEGRVLAKRFRTFLHGQALEAAETVCAGDGVRSSQVLGLMARLVDRSLVVVSEDRYRLLESVQAYCLERLAEAAEAEAVRERTGRTTPR